MRTRRMTMVGDRIERRRLSLVLAVTAALAAALIGPVTPALAASQAILSAGPLTRVEISDDLNCAVDHTGDTDPEFFGDTACGTLVAIGGTLYGPAVIPAGGLAAPRTAFTPISQSAVTGAGTNADPYTIVTVVGLGATGLTITETDSYVVGQETYRTDVTINNPTIASVSAILYRAGDCFLQNSDLGFGAADANGAVSCVAGVDDGTGNIVPGNRIEQWFPLSSGSSYYEAFFSSVWAKIGSQTAFTNSCEQCANYVDNGAGLSWNVTVAAGSSATRSHLTVFSPLGVVPLTTTKTAAQPSVAPGAADSYTITISNPNTLPVTLTSITDSLPAGFTYTAGSTTGATTADPGIVGQDLTWTGSFPIAASGSITLTFGVTVSSTPGTYFNAASATAQGQFTVVGTGATAPVTVTAGPSSAHLTLTKIVDNTGGGTALATAWTLSATGPTTISGASGDAAITNAAVDAGTYVLAEANGPTGYSAGSWSCTGGQLTGSSLVLAAGDTASCSITNTFVPPPVIVGQLTLTDVTCQQYAAGTATSLARVIYSVVGGLVHQDINPGAFFYFSTVTVNANDVVTTSQSTTNSSGARFLLNQGHATVYGADCTRVGAMASTDGGATASFTFTTAGTYILRLQYTSKSIVGSAAPSPINPTYTFDTHLNGAEVLADTTSMSLFMR